MTGEYGTMKIKWIWTKLKKYRHERIHLLTYPLIQQFGFDSYGISVCMRVCFPPVHDLRSSPQRSSVCNALAKRLNVFSPPLSSRSPCKMTDITQVRTETAKSVPLPCVLQPVLYIAQLIFSARVLVRALWNLWECLCPSWDFRWSLSVY